MGNKEMNNKRSENKLHLSELLIENFRGIKGLSIPQLGRVTLLAGRNGVGKTTVLEAIKVYAGRATYTILQDLLMAREEFSVGIDEDGDNYYEPEWGALFYGRDTSEYGELRVGSRRIEDRFSLEAHSLSDLSEEEVGIFDRLLPNFFADGNTHTLKASFEEESWIVPVFFTPGHSLSSFVVDPGTHIIGRSYLAARRKDPKMPPSLTCESLGPGLIDNSELSRYWDNVALRDDENHAVQALNLIYKDDVDRVTMIGDDTRSRRMTGRRAAVKLKSQEQRVPLRSLGDGALRLFGVALALANSRDGFLLIDEAENGIHYSVQRDYWRMVLQTARNNNVQVFATTHSWDCIAAFARAASEDENAEGVLVRLEKTGDHLQAVEYSEEDMETSADQGIEMR